MSAPGHVRLPSVMHVIRSCDRQVVDLSDGTTSLRLDVPSGEVRGLEGAARDAFARAIDGERGAWGAAIQIHVEEAGARVSVLPEQGGSGIEIATPSAARLLCDEDIVVVLAPSIAVVARAGAREVESLAIALPGDMLPDAVAFEENLWILAGTTLLRLDLDELPWSQAHQGVAMAYEPLGPLPPTREPATVAAVVGQKVLVDHPIYARLMITRVEGDPPVERGALLSLDQVVEPHKGLFQVRAWSPWSGAPRSTEPRTTAPPLLRMEAPDASLLPVRPVGPVRSRAT